jgi:hypothetical protein
MQAVNHDQTRRKPGDHNRGYWVPEPNMFARVTTPDRLARYVAIWLAVRTKYLEDIVQERQQPATAALWRTFLNGCHYPSTIIATTNLPYFRPRPISQPDDAVAGTFHKFVDMQFTIPPSLPFYHYAVDLRTLQDGTSDVLFARVMWDLTEHSFRIETIALDKLVAPSKWYDDTITVPGSVMYSRIELLCRIWPCACRYPELRRGSLEYPLIKDVEYPTIEVGLLAEEWRDRLVATEAFRELLSAWPSAPPELLTPILSTVSEAQFAQLELVAAKFYCQTFCDWYGRPPAVPHRIP